MKKCLLVVAVALFAMLALSATAKADILLQNGSFENTGAVYLAPWEGDALREALNWVNASSIPYQASSAPSGGMGILPTDGSRWLHLAYDAGAPGVIYQNLGTMVAGDVYSFTADVLDAPGYGPYAAYAAFRNDAWGVLNSQTVLVDGATGAFGFSYTALAGDDGRAMYIYLEGVSSGNPGGDYGRGGIDKAVVLVNGLPPVEPGWNKDVLGDWSVEDNWIPTTGAPSGDTATATFGTNVAGPVAVNVDAPVTINKIVFNNANKYTLGGSALTLAGTVADPTIRVDTGSHEIAAPVVVNNGVLRLPITGELTLSGVVSGNPAMIDKSGTGTLNLTNDANSFTCNVVVQGGGYIHATSSGAWGTNVPNRILHMQDGGGIIVDTSYALPFDIMYAAGGTASINTKLGATLTFAGEARFIGDVIFKDGPGTLNLTGAGNGAYMVVREGTLQAASLGLLDMAPGTTLKPNGTLNISPTHLYVDNAFLKFDIGSTSDLINVPDLGANGINNFIFTDVGGLYAGQTIPLINHTNPMWVGSVANFACPATLGYWDLSLADTGSAIVLNVSGGGGDLIIGKYNDVNGDGSIAGDPLLGDWTFGFTGPVIGGVTDNGVGDMDPTWGIIKLADMPLGDYTVYELPGGGWTATYDSDGGILGTVVATVVANGTTTVQFGNTSAVPEPAGLGLIGLALLGLRKRRS